MSTICSPVKLTPPSAKKGRPSIDWQRCIICQVFTAERLCIPTTKGRSTFISAVNKRKDEVYRKLVENTPFGNTKYHKSCYKAFTSKQNLSTCSNFKSTRPTSASCNQNPSSNEDNFTIVTRSRSSEIVGQLAYFANTKPLNTTEKCTKFRRKIEPKVLSVLRNKYHSEMIFKVTSEDFAENVLYHSACITRYLLRNIKTEIEEPPMSEHENAFDQFVSTIQEDLLIYKKVFT
jgi:hypothetical protein